ncbi:MAG: hypothetical protein FJ288_08450 [Planctomycetes bacterium]|nr:hypothetical protein [Planctomycetota bacterium]
MTLAEYLDSCEQRYSGELHLLGGPFHGPGYHSRVADGTYVHDILNSADYAVALLKAGDAAPPARAADVLRKILSLQDTDPTSTTYGLWPWLAEEPLSQMAPPDHNWADFVGARLAQVLKDHAARLPADLVDPLRAGLAHAAWSIFRRNVGPDYTNVAVAGAGVALAAGELLGAPRLLDYGRRRLHNLVAHTKFHGGFNEYNSPTYTLVALHECERTLSLVRDAQARSDAERLRRAAWQTVAEHFHPGTGQWAGPHSRAYTLRLGSGALEYLSAQTHVDLRRGPPGPQRPAPALVPAIECPSALVPRFQALPEPQVEVRGRFIRREPDEASTWGTAWMAEDACLGSVSQDNMWTQRHVLIAYWRTAEDPAAALRLRFLRDGRDFASAFVRTVQSGPRALSVFNLVTDLGDFHHCLDRPAGGVFEAGDFRVRYELSCSGGVAAAHALGAGRFVLAAGGRRAVVHPMPGRFGPYEVRWTAGKEGDSAFVDGICYCESRLPFDLARFGKIILAAGLELLGPTEAPAAAAPELEEHTEDRICVVWNLPAGGLMVTAPARPHPYPK